MAKFKHFLNALGFDGWVFALTALASIVIGILDFTPLVELTDDLALRMTLVALGLTMSAVVAQTGKRSLEVAELRRAIGVAKTELVDDAQLDGHLKGNILRARKFVLDTTITAKRVTSTLDRTYNPNSYHPVIIDKVQRDEISYRLVTVIHTKERFENAIAALLTNEGKDFLIRYYNAPPEPIPTLNMLSIDNEMFYLGAFNVSDESTETRNIFLEDSNFGQLLNSYWSHLWASGKPLNEGRRINWPEVRSLAQKVGVSESEIENIIQACRNPKQKAKR